MIKMIKVYRGNIDGDKVLYKPGEVVEGEHAEHILDKHPTWCEKVEGVPAKPQMDKQMKPEQFKCDECGKEFGSQQGLASHSRVHKE